MLSKDILIKIAIELDLPDILEWINVNKRFNKLTNKNDIFWMNKFYHDYEYYYKPTILTWKEFYKYITLTEPNDLLWKGIEGNVLSYVVVALKKGADINSKRNYNFPLSKASRIGRLEIVKYLVGKGSNSNEKINVGFRRASENGHLEVVKYLVGQGANVRVQDDHALTSASFNGHLEVVKYLVWEGANVHATNDYALRWSSYNGHLEVVKYLVEHGANVNVNNYESLAWARINKHLEVVKYLESL